MKSCSCHLPINGLFTQKRKETNIVELYNKQIQPSISPAVPLTVLLMATFHVAAVHAQIPASRVSVACIEQGKKLWPNGSSHGQTGTVLAAKWSSY
jgi:hypothetical protein